MKYLYASTYCFASNVSLFWYRNRTPSFGIRTILAWHWPRSMPSWRTCPNTWIRCANPCCRHTDRRWVPQCFFEWRRVVVGLSSIDFRHWTRVSRRESIFTIKYLSLPLRVVFQTQTENCLPWHKLGLLFFCSLHIWFYADCDCRRRKVAGE